MASINNSSPRQAKAAANCKATANVPAKKPPSALVAKAVTRIIVKCNCGFPNNLFIRGEGIPGLNWEKGVPMKNIKADEWVWETTTDFKNGKIKVLINDRDYEKGENHCLQSGRSITVIPNF